MEFFDFCKAHGILINSTPPIGVWRRYPTETHPHKKNGAVKFMGDHAFVCDWATGDEVHVWKSDAEVKFDREKAAQLARNARNQIEKAQREAASKAGWIMHQCQIAMHQYLKDKGFEEEQGNVWKTEGGLVLVIPMRIGQRLVGCQLIREDGTKKFLFGQRTSEAEFVFDNKGPHILCEGYATALSIRAALKALKQRYTLHVCFSAGNMVKIAATLPGGFVVADNDASRTGLDTANKIGWPFFMPPDVGQDFNDYHRAVGLFKASQALAKSMK